MAANPFAALLAPLRIGMDDAGFMLPFNDGPYLEYAEVLAALAALAAAVPADLVEAGKVLEGVTAGPWSVPGQPDKICAEGYTKNGFARTIATVATPSWMGSAEPWANARFIAWCREGVPALLARIAAQEAQIKGLEAQAVAMRDAFLSIEHLTDSDRIRGIARAARTATITEAGQ